MCFFFIYLIFLNSMKGYLLEEDIVSEKPGNFRVHTACKLQGPDKTPCLPVPCISKLFLSNTILPYVAISAYDIFACWSLMDLKLK